MTYVIAYDSLNTTNGVPVGTVYVDGPLYGSENVFSYTYRVEDAAKYDTVEAARREISLRSWHNARPIATEGACDLERPVAMREP